MAPLLYILLGIYFLLILALWLGYFKLKEVEKESYRPQTHFTICVPFRNEAKHLPGLLQSLSEINYPKNHFEIIMINDGSEDLSVQVIENFLQENNPEIDLKIIDNNRISGSPKKDALYGAIGHSKYNWIVSTDADCTVSKDWLHCIDAFILRSNKRFIAAPVAYSNVFSGFFNVFQQLDFLSLQGATMGGFGLKLPFLCNGANLAFAKADFLRLEGYDGNNDIASGDDVFLMQKFLDADRNRVGFLKSKNALVTTQPQESWRQLLNQRKRWAAKAGRYTNKFSLLVSWVVLLGNLAFVLALFYVKNDPVLIYFLLAKILIDFMLIARSALFFKRSNTLWGYIGSMILYPIFTIVVAIASQLGEYHWKGRAFKK